MRFAMRALMSIVATTSVFAPLRTPGADRAVPITPAGQFVQWQYGFAACQGKVIYAANDLDRGTEPWVTDSTSHRCKTLERHFGPVRSLLSHLAL